MRKIGWLVCRTFIEKRASKSRKALFSYLPLIQKEKIENLSPPSADVSLGFELKKTLSNWVHPSWLAPFLKKLSAQDAELFLSAIDPKSAEPLKSLLKIPSSLPVISPSSASFFQEILGDYLLHLQPDLLPMEGLPRSSLSKLLTLSSKELRLLSELLGLHDLAVEIYQIIDNAKLKRIYGALSKEKEFFLKMLSNKKEPVVFKRIELSHWDGQKETLLSLLLQRGMNRLAKALYPEDPSFVWYVKHRMELEDAQLLSSFHKSLQHANGYTILSRQILEAISFLEKLNPLSKS
jgi:hypothetical protein